MYIGTSFSAFFLNGKILEELIQDNDLNLLNDGSGTHLTSYGNITPLDLTFITKSYSSKTKWEVLNETFGSDHFAIKITIFNQFKKHKGSNQNKWIYKKANWNKFNENFESLNDYSNFNSDNLEINEYNEKIISDIKKTSEICIPKTKTHNKKMVPYWNEDCSVAIQDRKKQEEK